MEFICIVTGTTTEGQLRNLGLACEDGSFVDRLYRCSIRALWLKDLGFLLKDI